MVLVTTLIFLVIMTMLGLASVQGNSLQERMAGNSRDLNLAFQAAEAALRAAEDEVRNNDIEVGSQSHVIADVSKEDPPISPSSVTYWYAELEKDTAKSVSVSQVASAPAYIIEVLDPPSGSGGASASNEVVDAAFEAQPSEEGLDNTYRITSRGVGATEGASVILQSTFALPPTSP
ncbi:pilus assembly protein PilX [Magnetovirga frankeli]|uniref:pilus assembly PilX family protein n=1 Tax=Magnetovirga frankeli TaxID=947516 RepID=UPI001AF4D773|nr:pilus assembly protein PilX [gamma proteobacterium SS-5]